MTNRRTHSLNFEDNIWITLQDLATKNGVSKSGYLSTLVRTAANEEQSKTVGQKEIKEFLHTLNIDVDSLQALSNRQSSN